jgi:hypothetical protein
MKTIEHPPLASERALYASLVTPAPEPHDPMTCEFCVALRGGRLLGEFDVFTGPDLDEPIPYRPSAVGQIVESLEQARLARVADGPVSLLPPEGKP